MAGRRLDREERALWGRVTASVRPFDGRAADSAVEPMPFSGEGRSPVGMAVPNSHKLSQPDPGLRRGTIPSNTLDASWDRKLATGRAAPERTIDLHGHTLDAAHARLDAGLDDAIRDGVRLLLLVTGRAPRGGSARGVIRASVGNWLAASRHAREIAAIRHAHPRHGGAGALYIVLRRPR